MIHFNFGLRNPFSNRWKHVLNKSGMFYKHKAWEVELIEDNTILSFSFRFSTRTDHAGLCLEFGFLGYTIIAQYYDTRHWNDDEGRFYNYDSAGNAT